MRKFVGWVLLMGMVWGLDPATFGNKMGYETSYEKALAKAQKEHKNIYLFMVTQHCPWCNKMSKEVLPIPALDAKIKAQYIPLVLDRDSDPYPEYLEAPGVPAHFFIDAKNPTRYSRVMGFQDQSAFEFLLMQGI
ncbi:MAG: hypothetical protein KU37_11000 [Sulfuricurvum sp. PC08-66]|nr:MAG: hypothetical protein KU37_11000 [Sulfuricurvum sp. PC08-66]